MLFLYTFRWFPDLCLFSLPGGTVQMRCYGLNPWWAMIGDSTEEFHATLDREGILTSPLSEGTTPGLHPPSQQPHHGQRTL
jgi:hypothetical protein